MKLLAVLGNPIKHSRSPEIHEAFANACGLDVSYRKVLVPEGKFRETARKVVAEGAVGFNITVPHKNDAFRFCDDVSEMAQRAQAVNTIKCLDDGRLAGHNTDGPGLVTDLTVNLGWLVTGKRVLILGAGGAVQGIVASLLSEQPECIDITNRTHQKAVDIAARVNDSRLQARHLQAKQKPHLNRSYDLVISGTSAGLDAGSDVIRLPSEIIGESTCCYDMIYANKLTPFLVWCQNCGCKELSDGLGMLVEQAGLAFQTWFNQSVETSDVIRQLRREL